MLNRLFPACLALALAACGPLTVADFCGDAGDIGACVDQGFSQLRLAVDTCHADALPDAATEVDRRHRTVDAMADLRRRLDAACPDEARRLADDRIRCREEGGDEDRCEDRPDADRPDEDRPDEDRPDDRPDADRPDEERPSETRPQERCERDAVASETRCRPSHEAICRRWYQAHLDLQDSLLDARARIDAADSDRAARTSARDALLDADRDAVCIEG